MASNTALTVEIETHNAELREAAQRHENLVDPGEFKDEVTAMLVHDLKNPLALILINCDFVMEGFEGSDECMEALKDAQVAGRRMLRLLTNLADVRKAENGSLSVKLAPVGLSKVLGPLADQRRTLCRSRDISLELVQSHFEVVLSADPDLLTPTLENILDNALRHTPLAAASRSRRRPSKAGPRYESATRARRYRLRCARRSSRSFDTRGKVRGE